MRRASESVERAFQMGLVLTEKAFQMGPDFQHVNMGLH